MYGASVDAGSSPWSASPKPYMMQMAQVPVSSGPVGGYGLHSMDLRSTGCGAAAQPAAPGYFAMPLESAPAAFSGFKYQTENIVLAAGQYREVRPVMAVPLLVGGVSRFHAEPTELPLGLQLDPASGTIWGTPLSSPASDMDPAGPYRRYTIVLTGPTGTVTTQVGLKVVNFQPQQFRITHVSPLERNKYMVLIDARRGPH